MPEYVVMFPADDEDERAARTDADRQVVFDIDFEFGRLLQERGGKVIGGAAVTLSSNARTITGATTSGVHVTNGSRMSSKEQFSGFFVVSCDSYDALVESAGVLVAAHPVVEIWPVGAQSDDERSGHRSLPYGPSATSV